MKKLALILCALVIAGASQAATDRDFDFSVIGVQTGSVAYVLRGELEGIYIDVAANSTQTVTVASDEQTLYTKAGVAADVWVPLLYAQYGSTGSALTFASYGAGAATVTTNSVITYSPADAITTTTNSVITWRGTNDVATTNSVITYSTDTTWTPVTNTFLSYSAATTATSNPLYGKAPLAGLITVTVQGAVGTTATNASTVTVVYSQNK